jgi:heavy metal translocating P-type ATPase
LPISILGGLVAAIVANLLAQPSIAQIILLLVVAIGSFDLVKQTWQSLRAGRFALDYIALTAIVTGVIAGELFVSAVICLMLAGGNELENYAKNKAAHSLKALINRIPTTVRLWVNNAVGPETQVKTLIIDQTILIRRGEVLPVDGVLVSEHATLDEASITGEAHPIEKVKNDPLTSGTVNTGDELVMRVTKTGNESTYHKIIALVTEAQSHKSPLIRLADRYSGFFTLITLALAGGAWLFTGSIDRALAVLVMATPCPLILAAPIALLGGMNALAKRGSIVKNLGSLEQLARATDIVFDKTGTLTEGELQVNSVKSLKAEFTESEILSMAAAIEQSSLHPIAKAIVAAAQAKNLTLPETSNTVEKVGSGIEAQIKDVTYSLSGTSHQHDSITLSADSVAIGEIELSDHPKAGSAKALKGLLDNGLKLHLLSGDNQTRVDELMHTLGVSFTAKASMSPAQKNEYITSLQKQHALVAMIGDGINDAPAVAQADVGIVFSHDEESASSNAADVVLINNNFSAVTDLMRLSKTTFGIALQSIWIGMGLSLIGMGFASVGLIPPLMGALAQEAIDVLVILNALRTSRK